jgi:hypothetical protein
MDPRAPFMTEEFVQYAAECRRMARLARRPGAASRAATKSIAAIGAEQLRKWSDARPDGRRPRRAALATARRFS